MLKSKIWRVSIFIGLFLISITIGILLSYSKDFKVIDTFSNVIYITIKSLALLAILLVVYLIVKDDYKSNSLIILYATLIIQLVPLASRLILAGSSVTTGSKILVIVLGILSNLSLTGLYIFTEEDKNEENLD